MKTLATILACFGLVTALAVDMTGSFVAVDNGYTVGAVNPHPGYFRDVTVIQWNANHPGFESSGLLTEIELPAPENPTPSASVDVWLVTPLSLTAGTFQTMAHVGTFPAVGWQAVSVSNLRLPVRAGDMLAFRGNGCDLSHSGYAVGLEGCVLTRDGVYEAATRKIHYTARIATGKPGAAPVTTLSAWDAKSILWVGTSIPAHGWWMTPPYAPYPDRVGAMLGATIDNQAMGSSRVAFDGSWYICLGATKAEYAAAGWPAWDRESYEVRMLGKTPDLIVWDHGHNDCGLPLGTIDSTDVATYYGASNRVLSAMLAQCPTARIVFTTPPTIWSYNGTIQPLLESVRLANFTLAARYGSPVIDLMRLCGFSQHNHALYFPDGIHPSDAACQRIAEVIAAQLRTLK